MFTRYIDLFFIRLHVLFSLHHINHLPSPDNVDYSVIVLFNGCLFLCLITCIRVHNKVISHNFVIIKSIEGNLFDDCAHILKFETERVTKRAGT